jgi:SAM-dependent methyltransferase
MSFWPLAKSLTDLLVASRALGPLVELGCGRGEFARRLEALGLPIVLLDRDRNALSVARALSLSAGAACGTVQELQDASVGAIACSNLLRHCRESWERVGEECERVMAEGALFVVLEDDAEDEAVAASNYRLTLDLLASADPTRGPALAASEIERLCTPRFGEAILSGSCQNELEIDDAQLPLRWLAARELDAQQRLALERLTRRVERYGMSYGRYFYRVYRRGSPCAA